MRIILFFTMLLFMSCSKDAPKREFGTNPFTEVTTPGDNLTITVEWRLNQAMDGMFLQSAIHSNRKMELGDARFYFSWKVSNRPKRDTVIMLMPYQFRTWINGTSLRVTPGVTVTDIVFIRAENVKQTKINYQPL